MIVKITANFRGDGESRRHRQTNSRHFVEICAFAAEQTFHPACSVGVPIPKVVNVTRRACSLSSGRFARSESHRFPRALKSFSKIRFSFCGHNLAAAAVAGMTKRQTKFGRRDVNDLQRKPSPFVSVNQQVCSSRKLSSPLATTPKTIGSVVKLARFRRLSERQQLSP